MELWLTHDASVPRTVVQYGFWEGDQAYWELRGEYGNERWLNALNPVIKKSNTSVGTSLKPLGPMIPLGLSQ